MHFQLFIQTAIILLMNKSSMQDGRLVENGEYAKIDRIDKMNKKLDLIEEEAINQNQLIDALEQDTFLPHQTVSLVWPLSHETNPKLKEKNELQKTNHQDHNHYSLIGHNFHALPEEVISVKNANGEPVSPSNKMTHKKVWKRRNSKLIDKQKATSAMPYSTSPSASSPVDQNMNSIKEQDTTRYIINTYSSVSYNPPHHHLHYKQLNIKATTNQTISNTLLPSTISLARFNDEPLGSTTQIHRLKRLHNRLDKEEQYEAYNQMHRNSQNRKYVNSNDHLKTTPISILMTDQEEIFKLSKVRTRRTKSEHQNEYSSDNLVDKNAIHHIRSSNFDLPQHHLLTALNLSPINLLADSGKVKNKSKNQVELHLNSSEIIKINWPVKKAVDISGDISLGSLMMVHERSEDYICGAIMPQGGIQALECMLYTLDWINNQTDFLPGIRLGAYILDDCDRDTYGLEQSIDFIKGSISNINDENYLCKDGSSPIIKQNPIAGVLGAASSMTSIQVANLLRLFRIPQISFFSTSPELSNKDRFEYFLRTVPSDTNQVKAMVEIVKLLNWTYVSVIYEESNYGDKAFSVLEIEFAKNHICIAVKEKLTKDSGVANYEYYEKLVRRLRTKPSARGVIIFASDQEVAGVMDAVNHLGFFNHFQWIGSDGWSSRAVVTKGKERVVEGTLSLQPRANSVSGFDQWFRSLRPQTNSRNPWFEEYWESIFQCKFLKSQVTPNNIVYMSGYASQANAANFKIKTDQTKKAKARVCTGNEEYSSEHPYEPERQLQFVADATLAFAYAFKKMHQNLCNGERGLCDAMRPIDGTELLKYLKTIEFTNLSNDSIAFTDTQDGPIRYNILLFTQINDTGKYDWLPVGTYEDEKLNLDLEQVKNSYFRRSDQFGTTLKPSSFYEQEILPKSVCSLPCSKGAARKYIEGEQCCWHCFNCTIFEIILDGQDCVECPNGELPDEDQLKCIPIEEEYVSYAEPLAWVAIGISSFGIFLTSLVIWLFYKHSETPVVKASGRELSSVLLGGILLCFAVTYILPLRPTVLSCALQRFLIGICFTIVYSALLTKTNRISRIFNASKKTAKKLNFLSPKSQLIICGCLICVQLIVYLLWIAFQHPKAIHHYPIRTVNQLICDSRINFTFLLVFVYPILLVIICTYYAFLTRKIPEAFNESKFIGFCMYSTIVIWLAFLPIFSVIKENVRLNIFTISCCINGSALTTLCLLFLPKVYIIVLHPEKNVRQQMKPFASTGNLKRSQQTSVSQLSNQVAISPPNNLQNGGLMTLHPNTNGMKFTAELTSTSITATDSNDGHECGESKEKKKSASILSISGEREMVLKNRSHVATQTSLDEMSRKFDDDEPRLSINHSENSCQDGENTEEVEKDELDKELVSSEIEIVDRELTKED